MNLLTVSFSHQHAYVLLYWNKPSCMTGQLGESTLGHDKMHEINMRLNSVAKCHNLKTYQACGCTEITTVRIL